MAVHCIPKLECSFPASTGLIPRMVELIRAYIHEFISLPGQLMDRIDIVLSEAITNGVIHGGGGRPDAVIGIEVSVSESLLRIVVRDDGDGFDPDAVPPPDFTGMKVGGRGVFIMRSIMNNVYYEDNGRVLVLEKNLGGDSES